ncbi:MAG: diaminopimelate epimerase, partial [Campylobacter sp.]
VRTYERGVEDETLACGTGMAACFYSATLNLNAPQCLKVYPKSGEELGLRLENDKILFSGAVKHCFDTSVEI